MASLRKPHDVRDDAWQCLIEVAHEDMAVHAFLTMLETTGKPFAQVMTELALHQAARCNELTQKLVEMHERHPEPLYLTTDQLRAALGSKP